MTKTIKNRQKKISNMIRRQLKKAIKKNNTMFFIHKSKINMDWDAVIIKNLGLYVQYVKELNSYMFWFDTIDQLNY